jgi:hypothetical protein
VTSTEVGKGDRSRDIRSESYLPTGVEHVSKVAYTTRVRIYDRSCACEQSHAYDQSGDIPVL